MLVWKVEYGPEQPQALSNVRRAIVKKTKDPVRNDLIRSHISNPSVLVVSDSIEHLIALRGENQHWPIAVSYHHYESCAASNVAPIKDVVPLHRALVMGNVIFLTYKALSSLERICVELGLVQYKSDGTVLPIYELAVLATPRRSLEDVKDGLNLAAALVDIVDGDLKHMFRQRQAQYHGW